MDDALTETGSPRRPAILLGSLAALAALLIVVLPLYPEPMGGGYGWAMAQYPDDLPTRQLIAFALSWFSPAIVIAAIVLALAAGRSAKAVAGAFFAVGASATITFVMQVLLVWTDVDDWRSATILVLNAILAGLLVAAGSSALRADTD